MPKPSSFEEAVRLFNQRQFFECHEVLEDLWRPLPPGAEKEFLQGLLQVGVGFHHLLNHNHIGAKNLLRAGLSRLEGVESQAAYIPPIDLNALLAASQQALQSVLNLGPDRLTDFPEHLIPIVRLIQPSSTNENKNTLPKKQGV